jgi:P27 family predicted phage terminase small subunit
MARIPNPKALNDLRGDPGRRRRYQKEPIPPAGLPTCPDHLDELAKQEWNDVTIILQEMNLLSKADGKMLEIYCVSYSRWRKAIENVSKYGELLYDKEEKGWKDNPYASRADRLQEQIRRCLLEFGMSPAARARMRTTIEPAKPQSKWANIKPCTR